MSEWLRLDVGFARHPKVRGLSDRAFRAYVGGLCHAAEYTTDGLIDSPTARDLASLSVRRSLVAAGLWHEVAGGYVIHDYLDHQLSRESLAARRAQAAEAGRAGGRAKAERRINTTNAAPMPEARRAFRP